jgi:hypothetical protein
MKRYLLIGFILLAYVSPRTSHACDPCALYRTTKQQRHNEGQLTLSLTEQFTPLESDDDMVSVTSLGLGYDFNDRWGMQLNIPFVALDYMDRQREGLGDSSISVGGSPVAHVDGDSAFIWEIFGGIKLPTGATGEVADEPLRIGPTNPAPHEHEPPAMSGHDHHEHPEGHHHHKHHPVGASGSGRVLAIGSGSVDYFVGTGLYARQDRALFFSHLHYTVRTEGANDYRFGNELIWSSGPGVFLYVGSDYTVALKAIASLEHNGPTFKMAAQFVPQSS